MVIPLHTVTENKEKVIPLLKNYGHDTLSYFHLQDERKYFFSPSGKSFLSFKVLNKVAVVATDPVGEPSELPLLFSSFLQYTTTWKLTPCFIGLSFAHTSFLEQSGLRITKIGEEAILSLHSFDRETLKKKVKRAVRHIEERGVDIFFFSPSNLPVSLREQIERVSQAWIQGKGGREKGFSMTLRRFPNARDTDCKIVVALKENIVLGYLCFAPAYRTATVSLDQARRRKDAPNGLNEFLIVKSAEYFKSHGIKKVSLNFATFSNIAQRSRPGFTIRVTMWKVLEKMYKCNSLRLFCEKFSPTWESRYVAYPTLKHLPLYMLAILRAER
ncbi:MAG TPA: DUF2156 domain-containing protein [Patescibacteria group bacterium]|nr:DUF2156 domain-containing protein [Patescibacteria group bacterium]